MPKEFLIFEKGKYPQGDYSNVEVLTEFVNRFNDTKIRMACFVGHKYPWQIVNDDDELSHGEITSLRINQRGQIFAVDYELDDYMKDKIAKRQLLSVSPEIYGDGEKKIDITGLAFIGRSAPQNPFAIVPALFGFNKDQQAQMQTNFTVSFKFEKDFFKSFSRKNINNEENEPMTEEEKKNFATMQDTLKATTDALNLANQKIDTLEKNQANFRNQNRTEEASAYFGKLRDDGIIMPADLPGYIVFDATLNDEQKKSFRSIVSKGKKIVDLSGQHCATGEGQGNQHTGDVYDQIKVFQAENKITSFEEAAKIFYRKNPRAFGDEEGGNA